MPNCVDCYFANESSVQDQLTFVYRFMIKALKMDEGLFSVGQETNCITLFQHVNHINHFMNL